MMIARSQYRTMLNSRHVIGLLVLLLLVSADTRATTDGSIDITLGRSRVGRGETVGFRLQAPGSAVEALRAVLLQPSSRAN